MLFIRYYFVIRMLFIIATLIGYLCYTHDMKIHRFYITQPLEINPETHLAPLADEALIHQWRNVLRFEPGEIVELFLNDGITYRVKLIELTKKLSTWEVIEQTQKDISQPNVSLYLSVIKKDNFELATQKVTEIGISEITPILSSRAQTKPLNFERLKKIAIEATEQSNGICPPTINQSKSLDTTLQEATEKNQKIIICEFDGIQLNDLERNTDDHTALFIGPEGGWSEDDRLLFEKYSATKISFGEKVLRAETAAIVGVWEFRK